MEPDPYFSKERARLSLRLLSRMSEGLIRIVFYAAWVSRNEAQPRRAVNAAEKTAGGKPKYLTESATPTT